MEYGLIRLIASVKSFVYVAIPHFLGIYDDINIASILLFFSLKIFFSFSKITPPFHIFIIISLVGY
jgi:hypothetical protein